MTNIWKETFEEVRKPHFEIEDPYTKLQEGKAKKDYDKDDEDDKDDEPEEKAKKDYDGDGEVESKAKEYRGVIHNAIQRKRGLKPDGKDTSSVKESLENLVEVDATQENEERLDVKRGIKNKVIIGPQIKEEVEEWVSELIEEGYDLSEFTWDEMTEIYESAELNEGTAGMPAPGDATTMSPTEDTPSKNLARAQVRKNIANARYQRAVAAAANESYESTLNELSIKTLRNAADKSAEKVERLTKAFKDRTSDTADYRGRQLSRAVEQHKNLTSAAWPSKQKRRATALKNTKKSLEKTLNITASYDPVIEYLSQRENIFENIEEGILKPNPKQSKYNRLAAAANDLRADSNK